MDKTTTPSVEELAGTLQAALDDLTRELERVAPLVDALEAHPDEPSTYDIRQGLDMAARGLSDAAQGCPPDGVYKKAGE